MNRFIFLLLVCMLSGCAEIPLASDASISPRAYLDGLRPRLAALASYPEESTRIGEQGVCNMRFVIRRDGKLVSGKILKSSGFPRLDAACLATLKSVSRFPPLPESMEPQLQKISVVMPIYFQLPSQIGFGIAQSVNAASKPRSYYGDIQDLVATHLVYPLESLTAGEEGVCKLRLTIRRDGSLASARIIQSSGFARLDEACLQACRDPVFPAVTENVDEKQQEFLVEMPIDFSSSP